MNKDDNDKLDKALERGQEGDAELPIKIDIELIEEERERLTSRRRLVRIASLAVMVCVLITIALCLFKGVSQVPDETGTPLPSETQEEWRGAFAQKEIYETCLDSSVTVRIERGSGDGYWSGFVFSEDGWIATSLETMDRTRGGRIYVIFNDGREFLVDSILLDRESSLALIKINAEGLSTVTFRSESVQNGEDIISVAASADNACYVRSGEISGASEGLIRVNISLGAEGTGAPLFDEQGNLVAISCAAKSEGGVGYAISAEESKKIFDLMRGSQN